MEAAEQAERNAMQVSLFDILEAGGDEDREHGPQYVEVARWSERQKLNEEKLALGFYFSGHPFHSVQAEVSRFVRKPLAALEARKEVQWLAGLVVGVRTKLTARGKMVFIQLDDGTTSLEVSVFSELLESERAKIREDEVLIVEGRVQRDDFAGEGRVRIIAEHLLTLAEARGRLCPSPAPVAQRPGQRHRRARRRAAPAHAAGALHTRHLPGPARLPQW
jgi:DNA polymerase-3 subunit alpha